MEKVGSLKIIGFKVSGFRKLTAVELKFDENGLLIIKGDNEQGKTSLWKALQWLIEGNSHLNQDIIQHGMEKIDGELNLGDYVITRTATKKSNTLKVKNTKTNTFEKGEVQRFLDTLVNVLTFNPRPFANKTSLEKYQFCLELFKEQLEKLSQEVIGIGFGGIDTKIKTLEQERLDLGREVKQFGDLDKDIPEKVAKVDVAGILAKKKEVEARNKVKTDEYDIAKQKEIEDINAFNKIQRDRKTKIEQFQNDLGQSAITINALETEIAELETKLKAKRELRDVNIQAHDSIEAKLKEIPQPEPEKALTPTIAKPELEPTDSFDTQIQELGAINEKADLYEKHLKKVADKAAKQTQYDQKDGEIKNLRLQKLEVLRKVNTGVPGLEIREEGIYHNDIYCENWSDAEGLEISCELASANLPPLRGIFIDQGEALGKKARERLEKFAHEKDIQIGISIVADELTEQDKSADNVFFIVDGTIQEK